MSIKNKPRSPSSALLEMAQAYRQSAILVTACQLEVFTHLASGALSAEALARICGVPGRGLTRLLNACVVVDLLEKGADTYYNTPIADTFLVKGKAAYMGDFITSGSEQYEAWGRLTQAVLDDRPVNPRSPEELDKLPPERIRRSVEALYERGKRAAVVIADRLDLTQARQMLDVAGGSGIYSIIFAQRQPALRATVFDLPPIVAFTREIIARHGMTERVAARAGNFDSDEFGNGYDVVLLSNVLQTQGPQTCRRLLCKAFNALAPGGQLVIHGVMPNADRVSPPQPALFQVQMLLSYPEGDAHPAEDICTWAQEAGFTDLATAPLPPPAFNTLITARKSP